VRLVALEVEHGVDQMLEHARAGERAFLGDVPDDEARRARALARRHQHGGRLPHLADAAGRRAEPVGVQRLDGVDDRCDGLASRDLVDGDLGRGLGEDQHAGAAEPQAIGAQPHLLGRLLTGDVEDGQPLRGERAARLERERRLSDAGIAAEQNDGAGDETAAQHAIELPQSGRAANGITGSDAGEGQRTRGARRSLGRRHVANRFLHNRAPGGASGALAEPARRAAAALLADEKRLGPLVNHAAFLS
jgi:hypothetical protein